MGFGRLSRCGRSFARRYRQFDYEFRAFPEAFAVGQNAAAMYLDDCFADGKAETKTFMSCTGLFESVKNFFKKLWFNTNTIVADLDGNCVRVRVAGMDE